MKAPLSVPTIDRPALHVVSAAPTIDDAEALQQLRANPGAEVSAAELAEAWGWSRAKVNRRLKAWTDAGLLPRKGRRRPPVRSKRAAPTASAAADPSSAIEGVLAQLAESPAQKIESDVSADARSVESVQVAAAKRPRIGPRAAVRAASGMVLIAAAAAIAWYGVRINAWYGQSLGRTAEASTLLAGLSISADVLALLLPAAARTLWLDRHRAAAAVAWILWFVTIGSALMATVGFAAVNISDTTAARDKVAAENSGLVARIERLRTERARISETRAVQAIEAELQRAQPGAASVWKATSGCTDVTRPISGELCAPVLRLREAVGTAQRRDALDGELRTAQAQLAHLPSVMTADPQAETAAKLVQWLSNGHFALSPDDIRMARVFGMTLLPQLGGLVFMLALALCQQGRPRPEAPPPRDALLRDATSAVSAPSGSATV